MARKPRKPLKSEIWPGMSRIGFYLICFTNREANADRLLDIVQNRNASHELRQSAWMHLCLKLAED
jgi:hypothetical protein